MLIYILLFIILLCYTLNWNKLFSSLYGSIKVHRDRLIAFYIELKPLFQPSSMLLIRGISFLLIHNNSMYYYEIMNLFYNIFGLYQCMDIVCIFKITHEFSKKRNIAYSTQMFCNTKFWLWTVYIWKEMLGKSTTVKCSVWQFYNFGIHKYT